MCVCVYLHTYVYVHIYIYTHLYISRFRADKGLGIHTYIYIIDMSRPNPCRAHTRYEACQHCSFFEIIHRNPTSLNPKPWN